MNPIRIKLAVVASSLFLVVNQAHAVVIGFEDFEDATVDYVLTASGGGTQNEFIESDDIDDYAYFGRFRGTGGFAESFGTCYSPNTGNGQGYFAANNTNDLAIGGDAFTTAFMDINDIDINNFTNLTISSAFAESDNDNAAENWAANTSLQILARIDSSLPGDYVQVFGIEADGAGNPLVDTNLDGVGDGTEITDTFQTFLANISGTGSELDLRIAFNNFDDAFRDIALDSLTLEGDAIVPVPEPTSLALLGALAACGGGYRLRRRRQTAADVV
jgi:hypothetical protein